MATRTLSGSSGGGNYTYNVGSKKYTQDQLNNNMSGTDANAIYYATHGGSMSGSATPGMVEVTPAKSSSSSSSSGSKGSSGSSGSTTASISGGYSGGGGFDYAAMIEAQLAQQRAAAESAYRNSMARLESAWGDTTDALARNLDSTRNRLQRQYDYSSGVVNDDANKSLREAYVNYMMNKRNLNQGLSAMGLSGGATESSMAKLFNNYGKSRNNINTTLSDNIAQLLNEYQNNLSQAEQLYNTQFADARNNYMSQMNALEAALANNLVSSYGGGNLSNLASYATALNNIQNSGAYTPTTNSLAVNQVNTTQGNDMGSVTDYAKYKAMIENMQKQGATSSDVITQLRNNGASLDTVFKLLGAS